MEWIANNCAKGKSTAVFFYAINLWVLWEDLLFFIKAMLNNIQRRAVSQQPLSPKTWVHSQVSQSGVYVS